MRLTKRQADKLLEAVEGWDSDPATAMDPLYNLATDGQSEDRDQDSQAVQDALTDFVSDVRNLVNVAREVGLEVAW